MKKRILAFVLAMSCLLVFAGCSSDELSFYAAVKSIASLKDYSFKGTMNIRINNLVLGISSDPGIPEGASKLRSTLKKAAAVTSSSDDPSGDDDVGTMIKEMLDGSSVSYSGFVSASRDKVSLNVAYDNAYGDSMKLLDCIVDHDKIYISADSMLISGTMEDFTTKDIGGVTYDVFSLRDVINELCDMAEEESGADVSATRSFLLANASASKLIGYINGIMIKASDATVNSLFKNLTLGIVKKAADADNYTVDLDSTGFINAVSDILTYLAGNNDLIKSSLREFVSNLTDDELQFMGLDPSDRSTLLHEIDTIPALDPDDVATEVAQLQSVADDIKQAAAIKVHGTFERDKGNQYKASSTFSVVSTDSLMDEYGVAIDASVSGSMTLGEITVDTTSVTPTVSGGKMVLAVSGQNIRSCGILVSTKADMSGAVRYPAVKGSDGTYTVDLTGLKAGTTYYYQSYVVDQAGNTVSSAVKTLKTKEASTLQTVVPNPDTGSNPVPFAALGAAAALMLALTLRRRSVSGRAGR